MTALPCPTILMILAVCAAIFSAGCNSTGAATPAASPAAATSSTGSNPSIVGSINP